MTAGTLNRLPVRSLLHIAKQFGDCATKTALDLLEAGYDVAEVPGGFVCGVYQFTDGPDGVVAISTVKRSEA